MRIYFHNLWKGRNYVGQRMALTGLCHPRWIWHWRGGVIVQWGDKAYRIKGMQLGMPMFLEFSICREEGWCEVVLFGFEWTAYWKSADK